LEIGGIRRNRGMPEYHQGLTDSLWGFPARNVSAGTARAPSFRRASSARRDPDGNPDFYQLLYRRGSPLFWLVGGICG